MAEIRTFRAVRPAIGMEAKIAALPYDVYNRKEAALVVKKNPDSFLAIDRAETSFDDSVDTYDERVYQRADELLQEKIKKGDYIIENQAMYYIYALTMNGRTQHGFVACASIDDYDNQVIKKHENTRADKEQDRIHHVDTCSMQTGPIFLAYRQVPELKEIMKQETSQVPLYDFVSEDGIRHTVWQIADQETQEKIQDAFEKMQAIYIADGHHRCASAVKVGKMRREKYPEYNGEEEFNYFLSVLFPEEELYIMDYNRALKDLNGHSTADILSLLEKDFTVSLIGKEAYKPSAKGEFGFYIEENWYRLTAKDHCFSGDPVKNLDVSILQDRVLQPLFDISDPKTDKRIDFVGGIRGLKELERRCSEDCVAAFSMFPTNIKELFAVADAGLLMPPKSTWFEPKLRSGLFLHEIER
ncbi:MAG: DUF1015 domain-containing protein [Lachnospiraceae bacterium]